MEVAVDVPPYFLCPISLEIMRDPVTLCTGITYDRASIERWVFAEGNLVCPVSKQPLADTEMTPNHMLRRLVQAWCVANASMGVERFPTPKPPADKAHFAKLVNEARKSKAHSEKQVLWLKEIRELVAQSDRNRRCAVDSGVPDFLVSLIISSSSMAAAADGCSSSESDRADERCETTTTTSTESTSCRAYDEALNILHSLDLSDERFRELVLNHDSLIPSLISLLRHSSSFQSRAYATFLLKSITKAISPTRLAAAPDDLFLETVRVLRDHISHSATKSALRILAELCPWGRNRLRACRAGAVAVLVDILLDEKDKRGCEIALAVLDLLCGCADGRQELARHAAGVAVVSKKMLGVSPAATERAVRVLHTMAKYSATPALLKEMLQVGAVSKLCCALQLDVGEKTRQKVNEILRLHSKNWRASPCIDPRLLTSYPSS